MILYSCADLVWATRIKAAAEAIGVGARPVRSMETLAARLSDSDVRGLIVELEQGEVGERGFQMIERIRGRPGEGSLDGKELGKEEAAGKGGVRIVAFGAHVEVEMLRKAAAAGADVVMSRGAFAKGLNGVLFGLENGTLVAGGHVVED